MCPLCGRYQTTCLFNGVDRVHAIPGVFTTYQCFNCMAIYYKPNLEAREMASFYPENYSSYRFSRRLDRRIDRGIRRFVLENYYGYPAHKLKAAKKWRFMLGWLASMVIAKKTIPYKGDGRFLEIGCGGGSYLYQLKRLKWEVYGVDTSKIAISKASSLGLQVYEGKIEDVKFPDKFFDVIRLNHVLEHLSNPLDTIREIRRILKEEGYVYITVPNTKSLNFWLFGRHWFALDLPRHVISFSPRTLEYLCSFGGMKIQSIRYQSGPFNFVRSMKYFLEENRKWSNWLRVIDWVRNKTLRRVLRPFFLLIDYLRLGDTLVVTLQKNQQLFSE